MSNDPCCHKWGCDCRVSNGTCKVCEAKDTKTISENLWDVQVIDEDGNGVGRIAVEEMVANWNLDPKNVEPVDEEHGSYMIPLPNELQDKLVIEGSLEVDVGGFFVMAEMP